MRLAIDFDGTIADTNRAKAAWISRQLGLALEPWQCDRTSCVPIIGIDAYENMANDVYNRESTLVTPEVPGALDALLRLSTSAELVLVTARPPESLEFAREWLTQNDRVHLFREFHSSRPSSKEAICRAIGASILIDDDLRHLQSMHLAGLRGIHLQHGRANPIVPSDQVPTCRSWPEVLRILEI